MRRGIAVLLGISSLLSVGCREIDVARIKGYLGSSDAQIRLGYLYGTGEGVERDDAAASKWYRRAAEQGHRRRAGRRGESLPARHRRGAGRSDGGVVVPARRRPGRGRGAGAPGHDAGRRARHRAQRCRGAALSAPGGRSEPPGCDADARVHVLLRPRGRGRRESRLRMGAQVCRGRLPAGARSSSPDTTRWARSSRGTMPSRCAGTARRRSTAWPTRRPSSASPT